MFEELEGITSPEDEAILWRYMNFEKFVNLLATKTLFFTRVDKFKDPFEGLIPPSLKNQIKEAINRAENSEEKEMFKLGLKAIENFRKYAMCNCWHQNEEESMAMWEKYHIRNSGIAIKTTMGNLKRCFSDEHDVFIGEINYIHNNTYDSNYINNYRNSKGTARTKLVYLPYFHKRKAFEYEHEVRIIIDAEPFVRDYFDSRGGEIRAETYLETEFPDICETGIPLTIDVETLIGETGEVIISPYANNWITDTIKSVVHQYGFDFEVNPSRLLAQPTLDDIIFERTAQEIYSIRFRS